MNSLFESLQSSLQYKMNIDAHIHLFNWKEPIDASSTPYNKCIGFMDIEYDHTSKYKHTVDIYKNFIEHHYDPNKHILLATGVTSQDIKAVYSAFRSDIRGFGELKCYDTYQGREVPYKRVKMLRDICKLSNDNGKMPVYIHWEINTIEDAQKLEHVLSDYPEVPVVLCHCGIADNPELAYNTTKMLLYKYANLWADISYTALDYFSENPMLLLNMDTSKLIIGTDLNNKIYGKNHVPEIEISQILEKIRTIQSYVNSDNNVKKLFKL